MNTWLTTTCKVAGYDLIFTWSGGPYIDIGFNPETKLFSINPSAFDVINVYDYGLGIPSIPFTVKAFEAQVDEYINDPERDHEHDLANFAY